MTSPCKATRQLSYLFMLTAVRESFAHFVFDYAIRLFFLSSMLSV